MKLHLNTVIHQPACMLANDLQYLVDPKKRHVGHVQAVLTDATGRTVQAFWASYPCNETGPMTAAKEQVAAQAKNWIEENGHQVAP